MRKFVYLLVGLILLAISFATATVLFRGAQADAPVIVTYPAPAGTVATSDYKLRINGANSFVHSTPIAKFTNFSFGSAPVRVVVDTNTALQTVDIRPKSLGITPKFTKGGKTLEFDLVNPAHLSIEINGNLQNPLFVFANPLETEKPNASDPNVIYFKAGLHNASDSGELVIPSGKTVYLEGGAIVRGKFRVGPGSPTGASSSNVKILGRGIVDSSKLSNPGRPLRINKTDVVTVDGPIFLGREAWGVVANQSNNVTYKNMKVINWRETSTGTPDGIDIVGSTNVKMDGVFVRSYDDAIAIKTDKFGWAGNVDGVNITNSVLFNGDAGNALEIGWETTRSFIKNVTYSNIDIIHKRARTGDTNNRAALAMHVIDGATVSNVLYDGIRIEDCQENYINFRILKNGSSDTTTAGHINGVTVKNVSVTGGAAKLPVIVTGYNDTHRAENVTFENLNILGNIVRDAAAANLNPGITNAYTSNLKFASTEATQSAATLNPIADAYVRGNNTGSGTARELQVKGSPDKNYDRYAYLRFDLSKVASKVAKAKLRLYATGVGNSNTPVTAFSVASDSWAEGITWNNKPSLGNPLAVTNVPTFNSYYEWDVTEYVNGQLGAGDRMVSFGLDDVAIKDNLLKFASRESSTNKPQLVLNP